MFAKLKSDTWDENRVSNVIISCDDFCDNAVRFELCDCETCSVGEACGWVEIAYEDDRGADLDVELVEGKTCKSACIYE